jgi:hypothetical protein
MIDAINPTIYQEHIQKTHEAISQAQWSDQYELQIKMIAPSTKQLIPIELIKSYSFKYKAFNTEKISIGTKSVRYFNEVTSQGIDIVFYNIISLENQKLLQHENTIDYFLKDDRNKNILPSDGSYLLPDEFYFYIEAYQLDASWNKKLIGKGNFLLDSELNQDFTSDGGSMQELTLTFSPKGD